MSTLGYSSGPAGGTTLSAGYCRQAIEVTLVIVVLNISEHQIICQVHLAGVGHPTSARPAHLQLLLRRLQEEERSAPLANVYTVDAPGGASNICNTRPTSHKKSDLSQMAKNPKHLRWRCRRTTELADLLIHLLPFPG